MIAYHTISSDSVEKALQEGLKRTSRGEKGDDIAIAKTDRYLDEHRPEYLVCAGISRDNNLYAYVANGNAVIGIADGKEVSLPEFVEGQKHTVLQLTIDAPASCFVSDLDLFDSVKDAIKNNSNEDTLVDLANSYWENVRRLDSFTVGDIRRPEIMIPYDIQPDNLRPIK